MSADTGFEGRLRAELGEALDVAHGPHREWASSPAGAVIAADPRRRSRALPWRLMAVAAVLAIGSLVAVIVATRVPDDEAVAGCLTIADYAAASAKPTPVLGQAPDVSFPPVDPTATMTTGLLQPGEWAVIANTLGPGIQIRVRDIRECGRLPTVRSIHPGGTIVLATVDARVLRDDSGLSWLGAISLLESGNGSRLNRFSQFDVPNVDMRTSVRVPGGFASSSTLILDVPATGERVTLVHPGFNTQTLPGLELTELDSPRVSWLVRDGTPVQLGRGSGFRPPSFPTPGASPTSGEVRAGEDDDQDP